MFDNLPSNAANTKSGQSGIYPANDGQGGFRPQAQSFSPGQNTQASQPTPATRTIDNRPRPATLRNEAQDIFSETEKYEKPVAFQPKSTPPPIDQFGMDNAPYDTYANESTKTKNKTIVFALMLISLMLVFISGWYAYRMFFMSIIPETADNQEADTQELNPRFEDATDMVDTEKMQDEEVQEEVVPPAAIKDTDGDGLTDNEEFQLGTNLEAVDTDGDGLFDREEVKVYKTDPVNTDSDNDGFADGIEVKGGYNPNGEGKLYQSNN